MSNQVPKILPSQDLSPLEISLLQLAENNFLQVIYPLSAKEAASNQDGFTLGERLEGLDAELDKLMGIVRLKYLVERQGGWDSVAEWGDTLSLGKLQYF